MLHTAVAGEAKPLFGCRGVQSEAEKKRGDSVPCSSTSASGTGPRRSHSVPHSKYVGFLCPAWSFKLPYVIMLYAVYVSTRWALIVQYLTFPPFYKEQHPATYALAYPASQLILTLFKLLQSLSCCRSTWKQAITSCFTKDS